MKEIFNIFRYISWVAIICSLLGSVLLFIVGAMKTYSAYETVFSSTLSSDSLSHMDTSEIATIYLIKSLDTFLIALVLFIFAHGIFTLFIYDKKIEQKFTVLKWISTPNIGHLKNVLGEVIVIILLVKFLEIILINLNSLTWEILILPVAVLFLAVSLKLLRLGRE
ncbi:YqhA family protein [Aliiglaciecola lipolytica]|uniref:YqhA family protein n=1 Tax=Aliiglaciecola lipolytica TaxID=477689 RepID=UPI00058E92A7|nr:YqhA family protein [Aliiglaciecola lipolytica]|tara:strand:+ start:3259 stop:3756 length:498 start_codon:yes stop_codon:yes gene_type:complete